MKTLPLTKGCEAIIDDGDYEWLSQWKWTAVGQPGHMYVMRRERGKAISLHRLINNTPPGSFTDHIDGNTLNNTRANLRTVTPLQNMMNRRGKQGGTSSFKGVWLDPSPRNRKPWRSGIRVDGKLLNLGRFETEADASAAYEAAAETHFGEYRKREMESV